MNLSKQITEKQEGKQGNIMHIDITNQNIQILINK